MPKVLRLLWEEVRRDQKTIPAGFSYHLSRKDMRQFVDEYWQNLKSRVNPSISTDLFEPGLVFETFSRPKIGSHRLVVVDDRLFAEITNSANGVRKQS
jgi:hypothetical protein